MAYVAKGAADAYWTLRVRCWDVAAAFLIIIEAGGIVIDPSGS